MEMQELFMYYIHIIVSEYVVIRIIHILGFAGITVAECDLESPLKFPARNGRARARHKPSFCAGQGFAQKMALGSVIL